MRLLRKSDGILNMWGEMCIGKLGEGGKAACMMSWNVLSFCRGSRRSIHIFPVPQIAVKLGRLNSMCIKTNDLAIQIAIKHMQDRNLVSICCIHKSRVWYRGLAYFRPHQNRLKSTKIDGV